MKLPPGLRLRARIGFEDFGRRGIAGLWPGASAIDLESQLPILTGYLVSIMGYFKNVVACCFDFGLLGFRGSFDGLDLKVAPDLPVGPVSGSWLGG